MTPAPAAVDAFLARWSVTSGSELANFQIFLSELIALLDLPRPDPASEDKRDSTYLFERRVQFAHGDGSTSLGRIDLYKRGHFVCEGKRVKAGVHTRGFDLALMRARSQAEECARALPADEGRPPFLIVIGVGHTLDLYAEFSRSGATQERFIEIVDGFSGVAERISQGRRWTSPIHRDADDGQTCPETMCSECAWGAATARTSCAWNSSPPRSGATHTRPAAGAC